MFSPGNGRLTPTASTSLRSAAIHKPFIILWHVFTREREAYSDRLHLLAERGDAFVLVDTLLEVDELLALLLLDLDADFHDAVDELCHLDKVRLHHTARRHRRGADTHATRRQGALVAGDAVPVQTDRHLLGDLLDLGPGQGEGADIEQDQVVVRAPARELVPALRQLRRHRAAVLHDLLRVGLEVR